MTPAIVAAAVAWIGGFLMGIATRVVVTPQKHSPPSRPWRVGDRVRVRFEHGRDDYTTGTIMSFKEEKQHGQAWWAASVDTDDGGKLLVPFSLLAREESAGPSGRSPNPHAGFRDSAVNREEN